MVESDIWDWQVGVFGQNEGSRIGKCLESIGRAGYGRRVLITVVLNGTTDNSAKIVLDAAHKHSLSVDIYEIQFADKANAINRFFYELRQPSLHYCCVDAYVTIGPNTLSGFSQCFSRNENVNLATGIALNGRTEPLSVNATLEVGGIVHGQLYSLRRDFLERIIANDIRLPLGLYWGDGLLGSIAAHDADAIGKIWENARVVGVREATYEIKSLSVFSISDWRRQLRRRIKQMRGRLENAAIKEIIYSEGYPALPEHADDMVTELLSRRGTPPLSLIDWPFMMLAINAQRRVQKPSPMALRPILRASTRL